MLVEEKKHEKKILDQANRLILLTAFLFFSHLNIDLVSGLSVCFDAKLNIAGVREQFREPLFGPVVQLV
jgi:hypothetical protein